VVAKHPTFDYAKFKPVLLDTTGRKLTSGLFEELADSDSAIKPVFKLAEWRKMYVEIADPTDYEAARVLIGSWEHWQALAANPRFAAHLKEWRAEVEVKLRSEAIAALVKQSQDIKGTAAAKWLAEHGSVPKNKRKSEEDEGDGKAQVSADAARLGLRRVK
jgi:hypothetical protein